MYCALLSLGHSLPVKSFCYCPYNWASFLTLLSMLSRILIEVLFIGLCAGSSFKLDLFYLLAWLWNYCCISAILIMVSAPARCIATLLIVIITFYQLGSAGPILQCFEILCWIPGHKVKSFHTQKSTDLRLLFLLGLLLGFPILVNAYGHM